MGRAHRRYYEGRKVVPPEEPEKSYNIDEKAEVIKKPIVIFKINEILRTFLKRVREKLQ